ncbi:MAG: hypothetical protein IH624_14810 [Phycisphaerae bacterium]|nr:hypothetical protein [Phycisphaerae bacterium]
MKRLFSLFLRATPSPLGSHRYRRMEEKNVSLIFEKNLQHVKNILDARRNSLPKTRRRRQKAAFCINPRLFMGFAAH